MQPASRAGAARAAWPSLQPLALRLASGADTLARTPALVLAPLVVVQWVAVVVFALGTQRNGWLFYQGGDETFLYSTAWALAEGQLPRADVGYAWPALLVPIAAVAGPNFLVALPAIVLLQFFVLLPAALVAVYGIAAHIGGRLLGYGAATLWVFLPYLATTLFVDRYHEKYAELFLPQALGLTGLSDFPSMVALLVAAYFTLRALDGGGPTSAALAGLMAGLALAVKPANGLFLAAPVVAFAIARRPRETAAFGAAAVPSLFALAVWKYRGLGDLPFILREDMRVAAGAAMLPLLGVLDGLREYLSIDWQRLAQQRDGFREFFWSVRLLDWLALAGVLAVARRSVAKAAFLVVWLVPFVLVKGGSPLASVESGSFFRLVMPAFPAFFLLAVSIPLLVPTFGLRLAERWRAPSRAPHPRTRTVLAAAALVLVAVPLAGAAVLPPAREPTTVKVIDFGLLVPVEPSFRPTVAAVSAGQVRLDWQPPSSGPSAVQYRIYRSAPTHPAPTAELPRGVEGIRCVPIVGAANCALEMEDLGITGGSEWARGQPAGRWTYRVGLLAGWRGSAQDADLLLLSDAVTVDVPAR